MKQTIQVGTATGVFDIPDGSRLPSVRGRGRLPPGEMNKLETAYSTHLEYRRMQGEVLWWKFEGITLKLAKDTRITPDFAVMLADGSIELHEAKGHWEDDALVKIKVAAVMFPLAFIAVSRGSSADGGGWNFRRF